MHWGTTVIVLLLMLVEQLVSFLTSNTVTYVHHTLSYSIRIFPHQFEVATAAAFDLLHENPEAAVANFKCRIGNADIC